MKYTNFTAKYLHNIFYLLYTTPSYFGHISWPFSGSDKFGLRVQHVWELVIDNWQTTHTFIYIYIYIYIQGDARNVIPLIVHVTHFYYYKNI